MVSHLSETPRTADLFFCVSGQTPGGNVEAAGQSGGPHSHRGCDTRLTGGRRRVGGKLEGRQPFTGATPSPGGKVDCTGHWPSFTSFPLMHHFSVSCISLNPRIDYRLQPDL